MCGIAGFLGNYSPDLLEQVERRLAHRGPDGAGIWSDATDGIGMVHRRLAIIDPAARSDQPMWDATHRVVIVFNGEIYNYRELRDELTQLGREFRTSSDTEVILNAYMEEGPRSFGRLNGMFAFALWDTLTKQLVIARDSQGVKPLYISIAPAGVCFASELKALLPFPDVDRRLDARALQSYLSYLYSPGPRTLFRGVTKVPPGHCLIVGRDRPPETTCFRKEPYRQAISEMSADEAVAQARFFLAQAVERQMVADVPVGAFLSGGLDSSAIVNFARRYRGANSIECFTIGFEGTSLNPEGLTDDLPYAQEVARHLGVALNTVWVTPDISKHFEKMIWHLDEPQADPAAINVLFIARLARERGVKVLLSGAGGDDIFTGYRRHQALMAERYWSWLPVAARRSARWLSGRPSQTGPVGRRLSKALQFADETADRRLAGYFVWLRKELLHGLLNPDLLHELRDEDPLEPLLSANRELPAGTHPLNQMLNLDTRFFLTDHNLNYSDKMSMAAGVEVRVPFLDPDLMDFAARLPIRYKQNGSIGKWVLKQAMALSLPERVINRPKAGFGAPLRQWMRTELREHFEDALSRETISRRGIFTPEGVARLVKMDRSGEIDAAYPLFALVCIEMWCRHFMDARDASISFP